MFRGHFSTMMSVVRVVARYGLRGRALAAITLCVSCLLILFAEVSYAEPPRLISYGSLLVENALGVAVDQPNGDVYVAGFDNGAGTPIDKFGAAGELISPPSPFGTNFEAGAGIDPLNGNLYVLMFLVRSRPLIQIMVRWWGRRFRSLHQENCLKNWCRSRLTR